MTTFRHTGVASWHNGRALDLRSTGRECDLRPARGCVTTLGKFFTSMCLDADILRYYHGLVVLPSTLPLPSDTLSPPRTSIISAIRSTINYILEQSQPWPTISMLSKTRQTLQTETQNVFSPRFCEGVCMPSPPILWAALGIMFSICSSVCAYVRTCPCGRIRRPACRRLTTSNNLRCGPGSSKDKSTIVLYPSELCLFYGTVLHAFVTFRDGRGSIFSPNPTQPTMLTPGPNPINPSHTYVKCRHQYCRTHIFTCPLMK